MGVIGWVVLGLLAGGLARMVTGAPRRGCLATVAVGVLGALIGGALVNAATGTESVIDFNLRSLIVAFLGACLLLLVLQSLERR